MKTFIGLFYADVNLKMMVSTYMNHRNISSQKFKIVKYIIISEISIYSVYETSIDNSTLSQNASWSYVNE